MKKLKKRATSLFMAAAVTAGYGVIPVSAVNQDGAAALPNTSYRDGIYQGTGYGYQDGKIVLNVTISGGEIAQVELVSQENQSWWDSEDIPSLFPKIVQSNSAEVNVISGATESSNGVKEAVRDALSKAAAAQDTEVDVTAALGSKVNTENAASIWYGGQQWNVIGYKGEGVASGDENITLLMKGGLGTSAFDTDFDCDYTTSSLHSTLNKLVNGQTVGKLSPFSLSAIEKSAILTRTLETGSYDAEGNCDGISGKPAENELMWLLSTKEALAVDSKLRILDPTNTANKVSTNWWLRSPGSSEYVGATVESNGNVSIAGKSLFNTQAVRPAFHLSADKIAFLTAADAKGDSGVNGLSEVAENTTGAWKLTLKDDARSSFALGDVLVEDNKISVSYTGAQTGDNEYISTVVMDGGTVKYYGRVKALSSEDASGTAEIDLSNVNMTESDKLYVFNEHCNGSQANDFSSALYEVNTTSKDAPVFTQQPASVTVEEGSFVEFKALANGNPEPEYTWQINTGNGWKDIEDAEDYDYSISKVSMAQNGSKFRCIATNSHGTAISNSALLTVTERQLETYNITAEPNVKAWGTVSGAGSYEENEEVTVKATANSGYQFAAWTENDKTVSTDAEYTFTAAGNRDLVAVFEDKNAVGKTDYQQMYEGSDKLKADANSAAANTVWYGGHAWVVVGYQGKGIVSDADTMTLLAANSFGMTEFSEYTEDGSTYYGNEYAKSKLKTAIDNAANDFTDTEKSYVQKRDLTAGSYTNGYPYTDVVKGDEVKDAILWPLSPNELYNDSVQLNSVLKKTGTNWWLRSPGSTDYYAAYIADSGMTVVTGTTVNKQYGVRPAFHLSTDQILFLSDAHSGKNSKDIGATALRAAVGKATDSWKLTMKNDAYTDFATGDILKDGKVLTVSYSGAVTGENKFISAVVKDANGDVKYYGRLKPLAGNDTEGTVDIDLSDVEMKNSDALYVFNEEYNGSYQTDYASDLKKIEVPTDPIAQDTFKFENQSAEKTYGDESFTVTASGAADGSAVTYASSNPEVAAVDAKTGTVTIHGAGSAEITATAAATDTYAQATAKYSLTVKKATAELTVKDQKISVNQELPDLTQKDFYTVTGLLAGDKLDGTIQLSYQKDGKTVTPDTSKAGTYEIAASGAQSKNYEIVYKNGTLTIEKGKDMPFEDVVSGSYYENAVIWAVDKNITTGISETLFAPEMTCTRAQAVTFLWRAAGSPTPKTTTVPFTDVDTQSYYYNAVLWAVENNITKGTDANTFSPEMTCTRAQIVTFLWRTHGSPASNGTNPFTDLNVNEYYNDAVLWAVQNGITEGVSETSFAPDMNCTRGQIVTFLYRAEQ